MAGKRNKHKHHTEQNWNNLTELKNFFINSKVEKIKSFNGFELVTNKGSYGINGESGLVFTPKK